MESTIKLISKYDQTLVKVIQWLDSNGHSNTKIREKVDLMLNFEKDLKKEYQPGGSKRHVILQKAVEYLKDPRFGLQGDKQSFLMDKLGLSSSEYLQCLNDAAGGDCWQ